MSVPSSVRDTIACEEDGSAFIFMPNPIIRLKAIVRYVNNFFHAAKLGRSGVLILINQFDKSSIFGSIWFYFEFNSVRYSV